MTQTSPHLCHLTSVSFHPFTHFVSIKTNNSFLIIGQVGWIITGRMVVSERCLCIVKGKKKDTATTPDTYSLLPFFFPRVQESLEKVLCKTSPSFSMSDVSEQCSSKELFRYRLPGSACFTTEGINMSFFN